MPKNKLSQKYLDNVVLCRGPTHNFANLPQFAPDKKIYEYLPETDLHELIKNDPSYRITEESSPGLAKGKITSTQNYLEGMSIDSKTKDSANRPGVSLMKTLKI